MRCYRYAGAVFFLIVLLSSCSRVNINDEQAVLKDIQGTWTGCAKDGNLYNHIKLDISQDSFNGWLQTTDSEKAPTWDILPGESGTFSLSAVMDNPDNPSKMRKFTFSVAGRCCGDKSLTITALSKLLSYNEEKGLAVADKISMIKK
jgi:hypothetical protein